MAAALLRIGVLLLVSQPVVLLAQNVEVSPFVGYRFGNGFFERVTNQPVDLDGAPVAGGLVNILLNERLWFEGLFSHQDARVDVPGTFFAPPTRFRITVDQWLAGGLQEFDVNGPARPFFDALVGFTRYATEGDSEMRFAVGAGGGVKLRPHGHIGARLDGRVFLTLADLDGSAVFCRPGLCLAGLRADVVWQAEFTAGLNIAF